VRAEVDSAQERVALLQTQTLPEDLAKAQAEVARAQATLAEAKSGTVQIELKAGDVTAAQAEVHRAEAALKAAEAGRSQDEIKRQELASARADTGRAGASYRSAVANTVQVELKRRAADAARGQFLQAQAALSSAETELSYTRITASISGVIASVATQEGETVSAGLSAPTFVTIIDLTRLEVDAFVDETDIGKVKVSQGATFTVDSYPDKEFTGEVSAVYPKAVTQQNVVEYDTVITVSNTDMLLKPDMTANVTIFAEKHPGVLSVPNKAVRREGGQKVVYVMEGGKPVAVPVKTGVRDTEYTEILSGVDEGQTVLVGELAAPKSGDGPQPPSPATNRAK
jgi:macrolide-specific efflux system membrane fusion protein